MYEKRETSLDPPKNVLWLDYELPYTVGACPGDEIIVSVKSYPDFVFIERIDILPKKVNTIRIWWENSEIKAYLTYI